MLPGPCAFGSLSNSPLLGGYLPAAASSYHQQGESQAGRPPARSRCGSQAEIDLVFENTAPDRFDVGQVAVRNAFKPSRHLRGGLNVERTQPLSERAPSCSVNVFPNVQHSLIITNMLACVYVLRSCIEQRRACPRAPSKSSPASIGGVQQFRDLTN